MVDQTTADLAGVPQPISPSAAVAFLLEAASYFRNRPTGGEDMAFWSNVTNAENCERIAFLIEQECNRG